MHARSASAGTYRGRSGVVVRFAVLGPVEVSAAGQMLSGLAPRHRAVLAYLLLHAGTVISNERLASALWADNPPDTSRAQIHAAVTAIRRVLREAGADETLATRPAGYVALPGPGGLDLDDFATLSAREAIADLREALALWRGEALSGVRAEFVPGARARLEERRLAVFERLADLELEAGGSEGLIDELSTWALAYPLRERLAGQLMRALHAAGRQADALAAGRRYRDSLAEQQGLDPGRAFLAIEQVILRDQPPAPAVISTARSFLPYDVPDFTGRMVELDRITSARVCTIDGLAGVGKTTLAVRAAHHLADRYPGGQLFVDLRAHTAGQTPVPATEALHTLLGQLGVPAERIPPAEADRCAMWRTELAHRSVIVILDNASDANHVRPLLPGTTESLVIVTSRRRLTDLDGAHAVSMDVLPVQDAVALFTSIVGERARKEYVAAGDVLRMCGFLPLAVRIAAARLQHRPQWTVAHLANRLRDERRRLSELTTAERGVAAAFALSYQHLPPRQQRLFGLLGLHPGRDIDVHAAAALTGATLDETEADLEELLDVHMLMQRDLDRYTFHDLMREHARAMAVQEDAEAAIAGLLDHYLHTAAGAIDVLYPETKHRRPDLPQADSSRFDSAGAATAWLDAERANLSAVAAVETAHARDLSKVLYRYLFDNAHHSDALVIYSAALEAARRLGDEAAQAVSLANLGWLAFGNGMYSLAQQHFTQSIEHARAVSGAVDEARALHGLASVHQQHHDYALAIEHFGQSLSLFRGENDTFGEAVALNSLGGVQQQAGDFAVAEANLAASLSLFRQVGSHGGEADALNNLAETHRRQGRLSEARETYRQALSLYQRFGYRRGEARALNGLGATSADAGDVAEAAHYFASALEAALDVGNQVEQARAKEGLARHPAGAR